MRSRPSAVFQQGAAGGDPPPDPIEVLYAQTSQNTGGGTTMTVTLPTYTSGDFLLLIVGGNQTSTSLTPDANATLGSAIANVDTRRLYACQVTPVGSPSSFVLTASASRVWSAVVLNLGQVTPTFTAASNPIGTNTTSAIAVPSVAVSPNTDGHELQVVAALVNSSATWTAPSSPTLTQRAALTTAPGLYCGTGAAGSSLSSVTCSDVDRGNGGTNRNETVLHLVVDS